MPMGGPHCSLGQDEPHQVELVPHLQKLYCRLLRLFFRLRNQGSKSEHLLRVLADRAAPAFARSCAIPSSGSSRPCALSLSGSRTAAPVQTLTQCPAVALQLRLQKKQKEKGASPERLVREIFWGAVIPGSPSSPLPDARHPQVSQRLCSPAGPQAHLLPKTEIPQPYPCLPSESSDALKFYPVELTRIWSR